MVFIGSKNSIYAGKNASAYSSAKALEAHLARCIAAEGGEFGIRVNTVLPDAILQGSTIWNGSWRNERAAAYGIEPDQLEEYYRKRTTLLVIAIEAIKRIQPKDRIVLDASSTAWYMASDVPDLPLTVLTNSIKVAMELSNKEKIEVISTGGILAQGSLSFVGPLAERSLYTYHVDKVFLSCKGVHLDRGISESNELQARIKERMIGIADEVILLADSSKFGVQSFTHVVDLSNVEVIITDHRISKETLEQLQDRGITVITV
jgi:DeoR/GlpR family transcriptional regulator of sugar metabolism